MDNQQYALGVDIGGTTTKTGIVNHRGAIIHKGGVVPTGKCVTPQSFVDALYKTLLPVISKVGLENIKGIGVGAPNGNYYSGTVEYAPNLPWQGVVPLAEMIADHF